MCLTIFQNIYPLLPQPLPAPYNDPITGAWAFPSVPTEPTSGQPITRNNFNGVVYSCRCKTVDLVGGTAGETDKFDGLAHIHKYQKQDRLCPKHQADLERDNLFFLFFVVCLLVYFVGEILAGHDEDDGEEIEDKENEEPRNDPTLPQNRPDTAPESGDFLALAGVTILWIYKQSTMRQNVSGTVALAEDESNDPTLPQNRPDTVHQTDGAGSHNSGHQEEGEPSRSEEGDLQTLLKDDLDDEESAHHSGVNSEAYEGDESDTPREIRGWMHGDTSRPRKKQRER